MATKKRARKTHRKVAPPIKPPPKIHFYAIRIDETKGYNQEWLDKEYGKWAPTSLWSVYIVRPNQPTYLASLTPSSFAMYAYSDGDLPLDAPEEFREKLSEDLMAADHDDEYFDFKMIQNIIKDRKNSHDLGMYETEDESLTECQDAWEAARDHLVGNPVL